MKPTNQTRDGTSFHGIQIYTTVRDLTKVLGAPTLGSGDGKITHEWVCETDAGDAFTVYDWKLYRKLSDTELIQWHIGGPSREATIQAKFEILIAISKLSS